MTKYRIIFDSSCRRSSKWDHNDILEIDRCRHPGWHNALKLSNIDTMKYKLLIAYIPNVPNPGSYVSCMSIEDTEFFQKLLLEIQNLP